MKKYILATLVFAMGSLAHAETKEEMVAFVKKAVKFANEKGWDAACAEFSKTKEEKGAFQQGELYVYAYDYEGKVLCHGGKKAIIGTNLIKMKDTDGKLVIQELMAAAKAGGGYVEYKWENPQTKAVDIKIGYAEKVNDKAWLGSGIYGKK